jgi:acyl carrier protein
MNRTEVMKHVYEVLAESFEIDATELKPSATLYDELGMDSLDAVDVFTKLGQLTGRRPDPERAKQVRTVDDLATFLEEELRAAEMERSAPEART